MCVKRSGRIRDRGFDAVSQRNVFKLVPREIDAWNLAEQKQRFRARTILIRVRRTSSEHEIGRPTKSAVTQRQRQQCQSCRPCHGHGNGCQNRNDSAFSEYSPLIQRANFPTTVGTFSRTMANGIFYFHSTENAQKHQHRKHPQRVMADITSVAIDP